MNLASRSTMEAGNTLPSATLARQRRCRWYRRLMFFLGSGFAWTPESSLRIQGTWGSIHCHMRVVCAWCGTTVVEGDPGGTWVSHGICAQCSQRFFPTGLRHAVVPSDRSFLFSEIERAFKVVPAIRVIVDRRRGERRRRPARFRNDRRSPRRDRRKFPSPIVGALPAVAGLGCPVGGTIVPVRPGGSSRPQGRSNPPAQPPAPPHLPGRGLRPPGN
jgi:hypothetical protein